MKNRKKQRKEGRREKQLVTSNHRKRGFKAKLLTIFIDGNFDKSLKFTKNLKINEKIPPNSFHDEKLLFSVSLELSITITLVK